MNNLNEILEAKGIKKSWVAKNIGVRPETVLRWCKNTHQPNIETFGRLSELLNVEIKDLIK